MKLKCKLLDLVNSLQERQELHVKEGKQTGWRRRENLMEEGEERDRRGRRGEITPNAGGGS